LYNLHKKLYVTIYLPTLLHEVKTLIFPHRYSTGLHKQNQLKNVFLRFFAFFCELSDIAQNRNAAAIDLFLTLFFIRRYNKKAKTCLVFKRTIYASPLDAKKILFS